MTEKSEDQVIWVSEDTLKDSIGVSRTDFPEHIHPSVRSTYLAYVPNSKYLALQGELEKSEISVRNENAKCYALSNQVSSLKSDLAVAVEALEKIMKLRKADMKEDGMIYHLAKEALGKIGGGK